MMNGKCSKYDEKEKILPPLKVGLNLILELMNGEKVIGTLFRFNDNRLRLKDVRDYVSKETIGACCIYYVAQIIKIRAVDENGKRRQIYKAENFLQRQPSIQAQSNDNEIVKLSLSVINQIYDLLKHHSFITDMDQKYFDAIKVIQQQRLIGLSVENVSFGRLSLKASLLSVSTDTNIFIFDLLALKGFSKELKQILFDERPMKIIHNAQQTTDYLVRKENIIMNNIFDTMLAYFFATKTNKIMTVDELVEKLYNLPKDLCDEKPKWTERPLQDKARLRAAMNVVFLLEVHNTIVYDYLLGSLFEKNNDFPLD